MRLIDNIIWMLFGGIFTAIYWFLVGCLFSITIIGIPLGRQAFKMASLTLAPFGKSIEYGGGAPSLIANVIWLLCAGLPMAASYLIAGVINCITIIGIPFGLQSFKMAKLSLLPFGARVLG
ncbi:MAG: YccF domain-containing protein [Collinsella sp.]|nr:YccF domain-containing protein [Collinsella sp.]